MQLLDLTIESIRVELEKPVPELYLVIAKHDVMGLSPINVAEILGFELREIEELYEDDEYREVRTCVAAAYLESEADADVSWDGVEQAALQNLSKALDSDTDGEFNLKVAAMANRASRRHRKFSKPLESSPIEGREVRIRLTERMVLKMQQSVQDSSAMLPDGTVCVDSVSNGRAPVGQIEREVVVEKEVVLVVPASDFTAPPSFKDVDKFLGVTKGRKDARVQSNPFEMDSLMKGLTHGS